MQKQTSRPFYTSRQRVLSVLGLTICLLIMGLGSVWIARESKWQSVGSVEACEVTRQETFATAADLPRGLVAKVELQSAERDRRAAQNETEDLRTGAVLPTKKTLSEITDGSSGVDLAVTKNAPTTLGEDADLTETIVRLGDRPSWVEAAPVRDGEIHTISVSSGPHVRAADAEKFLSRAIKKAREEYIREYLPANTITDLVALNLVADVGSDHLDPLQNRYSEVVIFQNFVEDGMDQPMHQSHALLHFDDRFRCSLGKYWAQVLKTDRLFRTGLFSGGMIRFLMIVLGYFKLDTATRGFYSRRLQFASAAAILTLVAVGVFLANKAPWL